MNLDWQSWSVFLLIFLFTYTLLINWRRKLPGPWIWPVIGNIPSLVGTKRSYERMMELAKKYGNIFQLHMGPGFELIVVCGHKNLYELFHKKTEDTKFRPNWLYLASRMTDRTGILWSNGEHHQRLRRFSLTALRDFGLGKSTIEDRILEESNRVVELLQTKTNQPIQLETVMPKAVSNIISSIVFGSRFDYNDNEFDELLGMLDYIVRNTNYKLIENYFPFLEKVLPNSKARKILNRKADFEAYVRQRIEIHKKSFDANNIRDFLDLYIEQENKDSQDEHVSEKSLFQCIFDLYLAGSETTATSLMWIFLYMIRYPDIQEKCRDEIKQVAGNRQVVLKDREKLTYIVATINEIQRLKTIAAVAVPRTVLENLKVGNVTIPKRCLLVQCIISAHYDTEYWKDPEEFQPERFIDDNGKIVRHEAFYPFGLGHRACLGKQLAETELFLFFTTLLQKFRFTNARPDEPLDMLGEHTGITYVPSPYFMQLEEI